MNFRTILVFWDLDFFFVFYFLHLDQFTLTSRDPWDPFFAIFIVFILVCICFYTFFGPISTWNSKVTIIIPFDIFFSKNKTKLVQGQV